MQEKFQHQEAVARQIAFKCVDVFVAFFPDPFRNQRVKMARLIRKQLPAQLVDTTPSNQLIRPLSNHSLLGSRSRHCYAIKSGLVPDDRDFY